MFSEEVKLAIYIGISAMVAAMVLTLISFTLTLRGDLATRVNSEQAAKVTLENYEKYTSYNNKKVRTDEMIACISDFAGELPIYVEGLETLGTPDFLKTGTQVQKVGSYYKFIDKISLAELSTYLIDKEYKAILVFGAYGDDAITKYTDKDSENVTLGNVEVTAIKFVKS